MNVVHTLMASVVSIGLLLPLAGCDTVWSCRSVAEITVINTETGDRASNVTVGYFPLSPLATIEDLLPELSDLWIFAVTDPQGCARLSLDVPVFGPPPWYPGYGSCETDQPLADRLLLLLPDSSEPVELPLEPGAVATAERYTIRIVTVGQWSRADP